MTDPTPEPEQTPISLIQRLRLEAADLTSTYVATDAHGDPIERPRDGSEEADFEDPMDPVEFEPEQLHDLANLYREAATVLEEAQAEIAALKAAGDPPDRAPLLAQLEDLIAGDVMASACGQGVVELIRDAVAAIRTDARRLNNYRTHMEAWHRWGREMAGVGGDNIEPPEVLQRRLGTRFESGKLALLVQPIRRRVELVWALCADLGLGTEEAADLAPKAALWTDAEVAEIEAFRTRDWSGTGLNPFDHLPAALERTIYPGPGGRRAYLKRAGEPLPPAAPKPEDHQLGLPGMPKPETAMRLRLALIDKPDSPETALVAGFAQALLERLAEATTSRGLGDWVGDLRRNLRLHVEKGDPRDVAAYCAFAWHHGWTLAEERPRLRDLPKSAAPRDLIAEFTAALVDFDAADLNWLLIKDGTIVAHGPYQGSLPHLRIVDSPLEADHKQKAAEAHHADLRHAMGHTARDSASPETVESRFVELHFLADPCRVAFRFEGLPDVRVPDEDAKEMRRKLVENFADAPGDLPAPPGYTPWISMGNSGWAFEGKRVADDVLGAWAHHWGLSEQGAADLRKLVVAAARSEERNEFGQWLVTTFQPGAVDEAAVLFRGGEYESGEAFCRRVLQLALDRGAFAVAEHIVDKPVG